MQTETNQIDLVSGIKGIALQAVLDKITKKHGAAGVARIAA